MNIKNTYNAGLAPLAIVLIFVGVVVIGGGGLYVATRNKADVAVVTPTQSALPTATVSASASVKPTITATVTKKPVVAVSVKFATVQEAVSSSKSVVCVGAWYSEKGPTEYRSTTSISSGKIIISRESRLDGVVTKGTTYNYVSGTAEYNQALTYGLSSSTCTAQ